MLEVRSYLFYLTFFQIVKTEATSLPQQIYSEIKVTPPWDLSLEQFQIMPVLLEESLVLELRLLGDWRLVGGGWGRWITDWLNKIENSAQSSRQPRLLLERNKSEISSCEFEFIEAVNLTSHITLTHPLNSQQKINFNSNFSDTSPLTSHLSHSSQ